MFTHFRQHVQKFTICAKRILLQKLRFPLYTMNNIQVWCKLALTSFATTSITPKWCTTSAICSQYFSLSVEHFLLILLTYWINHFLKLLIVETSKRVTQYISNIQTIVYRFMRKNLLNALTVKRYFMYGFCKNYCYVRLGKTTHGFSFGDSTSADWTAEVKGWSTE